MLESIGWGQLGTATGVAAVVAVLTQILKNYVPKLDPKWIALVLSLLITFCRQMVFDDYAFATFVLSTLNGIIAAGMAIGVFESVIKPLNSAEGESSSVASEN